MSTSSTNYSEEWEIYNSESRPQGLSVRGHCRNRGVSYHGMLNWRNKNVKKDVTIVEIAPPSGLTDATTPVREVLHFSVELSNSLKLTRSDIDLAGLRRIVATLSRLC